MKKTTKRISALVGVYRPASWPGVIITPEGCVREGDVRILSSGPQVQRQVHGLLHPDEATERTLVQLDLEGRHLLADIITGTVYDEETGLSLSGTPRLVVSEEVAQ